MINLNEIKQSLQNKQIMIFEGEMPDDILYQGFKFNSLENLINFCNVQNIKICFIDVQYTNVEDYEITKELFDERLDDISITLKHRISSKVKEYNRKLLSIDDSNPTEIVVAVLYESKYFYYYEQDELLIDGEIILEPEDKLEEILELFETELQEEKEQNNLKIEEQKGKIKEYILNDPEFKNCTNRQLRKRYITELFKNKFGKDFKELKQIWTNPEMRAYVYRDAIEFIELVWREFRNNK